VPDLMTLAERTTRLLLLAEDPPPAVIREEVARWLDWNRAVLARERGER
jgi:hypothetical protein